MKRIDPVFFSVGWVGLVPPVWAGLSYWVFLVFSGPPGWSAGYSLGVCLQMCLPYIPGSVLGAAILGYFWRFLPDFRGNRPLLVVVGAPVSGLFAWVLAHATSPSLNHLLFLASDALTAAAPWWLILAIQPYALYLLFLGGRWTVGRLKARRTTVLACLCVTVLLGCETPSEVTARPHPFLACTPLELQRLRTSYSTDADGTVGKLVDRVESRLAADVSFPARGGQHNQWYQCDACEINLETRSDTTHVCTNCSRVYSGYPYDDVIYARKHAANLRAAREAGWAYAITQDERYARYTRDILVGYGERYRTYPYHANGADHFIYAALSGGRLFEQTLNEGSRLATDIGPAYDLVYGSESLTEQDHRTIQKGLLRPMAGNVWKARFGKNNWQSWHNAGIFWAGALLGDRSMMVSAIEDAHNGFHYQMKHAVGSDGMWYENSWAYHFYTLSAMVNLAEPARRAGFDLWSSRPLQKMFTLPASYAMPNGYLPRFGDDVNTKITSHRSLLEAGYAQTKESSVLGAMAGGSTWESILYGRDIVPVAVASFRQKSTVFEGAGHVILRSAGKKGLVAAATYGPYGGFHGHLDKLSFVFYGFGRELGVDPGRAKSQAYRLPIHRNWYKATVGHNAVVVDGRSQKGTSAELTAFAASEQFAIAQMTCESAYEGVTQVRTLVLTPEYLLISDRLASQEAHEYDWVYHNRGVLSDLAGEDASDLDLLGHEYIDAPIDVTERNAAAFLTEGVMTCLTLSDIAERLTVATGVGASIKDRVPVVIARRSGSNVQFNAVLEPLETQNPAPSRSILAEGGALTISDGVTHDVIEISGNTVRVSRNGSTVLEAAGG